MIKRDYRNTGYYLYKKTGFYSKCCEIREASQYEFTIKTTEGYTQFFSSDIIFTEQNRISLNMLHIINGRIMSVQMSSSELFDKLSTDSMFIRCGEQLNINLRYVRTLSRDEIFFDNGQTVRIPHRTMASGIALI